MFWFWQTRQRSSSESFSGAFRPPGRRPGSGVGSQATRGRKAKGRRAARGKDTRRCGAFERGDHAPQQGQDFPRQDIGEMGPVCFMRMVPALSMT